jgi:hypothetical protein
MAVTRDDELMAVRTGGHAGRRYQHQTTSETQSIASATIFMRGHALMNNIRHRFYRVVESVPKRLVLGWTWNRLAEAV